MILDLDIQRQLDDPSVPDDALLASWARTVLQGQGDAMLNLRIVDQAEAWALNRQWRGKDSPTNVLSFPADLPTLDGTRVLGDVVLCAPVIAREAIEQGKSLQAHWAHLVVHGLLHLLGFDHINAPEAQAMERREIDLLAGLGFPNPYEASHDS